MVGDVFVDTSGWGNLFDPKQELHMLAVLQYEQAVKQGHKLVTTNYVISELASLFISPLNIPRFKAVELIEGIKDSPNVEIAHVDEALDHDAWLLFRTRLDKDWSLVDCASFVVMQRRDTTHALTTDHHFEQAGFARLLKP